MSYNRPSCSKSSTNFAATRCGAGLSESLTKPLQRTPYHNSTAPTHGASPSKKRLTTLPSMSSHPGRDGDRTLAKSYDRQDDHTREASRVVILRNLPQYRRELRGPEIPSRPGSSVLE